MADRIYDALGNAEGGATILRGEPGSSLDLPLRDAEYYLLGLYAGVSRDSYYVRGALFALGYDLKKAAVQLLEQYAVIDKGSMQVNANPNSPPGGSPWAYAGLKDGLVLIPNEETDAAGCRAIIERMEAYHNMFVDDPTLLAPPP